MNAEHIDAEVRDLDADVRRAYVASQYRPQQSKDDPDIIAMAQKRVGCIQEVQGVPPKRTPRVDITGLAYLERLFGSENRSRVPNTQAISRFQKLLIERGHAMKHSVSALDRARVRDWSARDPGELIHIPWAPAITLAAAQIIVQIAESARVAPSAVAQLLIYYGLEHVARELRENAAAPAPKIPTTKLIGVA